jgi:hypothetical protein
MNSPTSTAVEEESKKGCQWGLADRAVIKTGV